MKGMALHFERQGLSVKVVTSMKVPDSDKMHHKSQTSQTYITSNVC